MLRSLATTIALVVFYYLLPLDHLASVPLAVILVVGLLVLLAVTGWQLRLVLRSLVGIAVEVREPKGIGRCRMAILQDASAATLRPFITGHIEAGARVITDAWQGYHGLDSLGYTHERRSQRAARSRGEDPGELLPAVHRVAALAKRWLLGTHQGSVDPAHLASYLDEFVFRFNRRRSASRGLVFYRLLELTAAHDPVRYRDLVASQLRLRAPAEPPRSRGSPPSLERPPAGRPWRGRDLDSSG